jgi:hypothetical protein
MQSDGNLVCYDDNGVAYWSSGTWGNNEAFLIQDGRLEVFGLYQGDLLPAVPAPSSSPASLPTIGQRAQRPPGSRN